MNMSGRPDLAMNRIQVAFPSRTDDNLLEKISRKLVFGYEVHTADGICLARGDVVSKDEKNKAYILHNYHNGIREPYHIPEEFDISGLYHPSVHQRLAKQCVAMTLFNYDPDNPGIMSEEEERYLIDEARGEGTYDNIQTLLFTIQNIQQ